MTNLSDQFVFARLLRPLALLTAMLSAALAVFPAMGAPADPAQGLWLTENKKAIVRFAPCGAGLCGHMVWVVNPRDPDGTVRRDVNDKPFCGLHLVGGLKAAASGVWEDGWIYNPRNGQTYSAEIEALPDDTLRVRGYLGLPLLGSSQIWTRVADDRGGCAQG